MDNTSLDQLIPPHVYQPYLKGRRVEFAQPLADLGYLLPEAVEDETALKKAFAQFRKEYLDAGWLLDDVYRKAESLPWDAEPDSVELKLLHLLVDMDGDFQLKVLPQHGVIDLWSRIVYYRLGLNGFYDEKMVNDVFDERILHKVVGQLSTWLSLERPVLEWVNLLGDVPKMIQEVYEHGSLDRQVVCFTYRPAEKFEQQFEKKINREEPEALAADEAVIAEVEAELANSQTVLLTSRSLEGNKRTRRLNSKLENLRNELLTVKADLAKQLAEKKAIVSHFDPVVEDTEKRIAEQERQLAHLKISEKELKKERDELQQQLKAEGVVKKIEKLEQVLDTNRKRLSKASNPENIVILKANIAQLETKIDGLKRMATKPKKLKADLKEINKTIKVKTSKLKQLKNGLKTLMEENRNRIKEWKKLQKAERKAIQKKEDKIAKYLKKLNSLPRRFRRELQEHLAPGFYKKVQLGLLDRTDSVFFNHILNSEYNLFLTRLLQLHQWTNGYYNGLMDSDIGQLTFNSIREIDKDIKSLKLRFVLYRIDDHQGTWLLNIRYLFAEMLDSLDEFQSDNSFEDAMGLYIQEVENNPNLRNNQDRLDTAWKETLAERETDLRDNKLRRIYFGIKSLVKSVVRGIARIVRIIIEGVGKIIKLFKNFVLFVYRETREALRKLKQGFAFLFGHRTLITYNEQQQPVIISKYDFDCDVKTFVQKGVTPALIQQHKAHCMETAIHLQFALLLTGYFIEWVFNVVKGILLFGWGVLMVRLGMMFRRLIKQVFRKNAGRMGMKVVLG